MKIQVSGTTCFPLPVKSPSSLKIFQAQLLCIHLKVRMGLPGQGGKDAYPVIFQNNLTISQCLVLGCLPALEETSDTLKIFKTN